MTFKYHKRIVKNIDNTPFDKLLSQLSSKTAFICDSYLHGSWGIDFPNTPEYIMFHMVNLGELTCDINGNSVKLKQGDWILITGEKGHRLSSKGCQEYTSFRELPIETITARYGRLLLNEQGEKVELICGAFVLEHPLSLKLLRLLPDYIYLNSDHTPAWPKLKELIVALRCCSKNIGLGTEAELRNLANLFILEVIKSFIQQDCNHLNWMQLLGDHRIINALELIHELPGTHWSLESLATSVGMSRSGFALQFKKLVGETPIDYLTEWRMSLAYSSLQNTDASVLSIALSLGYKSESSFSRAFKKVVGKRPIEVRKPKLNSVNPDLT